MSQDPRREPALLKATAFAAADIGSFEWDASHNAAPTKGDTVI